MTAVTGLRLFDAVEEDTLPHRIPHGESHMLPYLHGRVGDDGRRLGVEGLTKLHHVQPKRT